VYGVINRDIIRGGIVPSEAFEKRGDEGGKEGGREGGREGPNLIEDDVTDAVEEGVELQLPEENTRGAE